MELISVCPLHVAGTLRPSSAGLHFSVIACGTLDTKADGSLDLAAKQHAPDGDDLQLLEPRGRAVSPPKRSDRIIAGRVIAGGAFFAFDGASRELQRQRVVKMRPKLFIEDPRGGREVALDIAAVTLDRASGEVSVVWLGQSSVDVEGHDPRAFVALERDGEILTWPELAGRVDGLLSASKCERVFIEAEPTMSEIGEATVTLGPGETNERFGESPLPFGPASHRAPEPREPVSLGVPRVMPAPEIVDRRSIGQILTERPTTPRAAHSLVVDPDAERQSRAALKHNAEPGFALELVWHADGASPRLRKQPELKRLVLAFRSPSEPAREEHDVASVARGAPRTPIEDIGRAMDRAVHEGVLEAPALVIDGMLSLSFDPVETLRALVAAARALVKPSERVTKAIGSADAVTTGDLADAAWALAEPELARLRDAIASTVRPEVARSVEDAVDQKLTRDRKILSVTVLGAPHFVGHITGEGDAKSSSAHNSAAVYVPLPAADRWPLVRRFPARLIAEARAPLDDREPGVAALIGLAIYRRIATRSPI
jgi:hypothetical protein